MGSIGGYSFRSMDGFPPNLAGYIHSDVTRPGVMGVALTPTGRRGQPFSATTLTACSDVYNVGAAMTTYAAMKGSIVTAVDDFGNSWANLIVRDVQRVRAFYAPVSTDPFYPYNLICVWTLEHVTG